MNILDYYKASEMMIPSMSPRPPRGTLGAASSTPVYKDASGNVITSINCGQSYTFDVPGYNRVWLIIFQNGIKSYDGPQDVPMPPYAAKCEADVGTFQVTAYDVNTGIVLGTTTFTVNTATGQPSASGGTGTISPWMIAAGLAAAYFFFGRKG